MMFPDSFPRLETALLAVSARSPSWLAHLQDRKMILFVAQFFIAAHCG
jgi:hypothetical protein